MYSEFFRNLREDIPPFEEKEILKALVALGDTKENINTSLANAEVHNFANDHPLAAFPKKFATDPTFLLNMYLSCYFGTQTNIDFWYGQYKWNKFHVVSGMSYYWFQVDTHPELEPLKSFIYHGEV